MLYQTWQSLSSFSFNNSSLSNSFEGLVEDDTRNRNILIDNDEQAQSISTPAFGTPASIEAEGLDLTNDDNDESFWLNEKSDEMDCLFQTMCDNANTPSDSSSESVGFSQEHLTDCMIIVEPLVHRRKKFLLL